MAIRRTARTTGASVPAAVFKATCLDLLDQVHDRRARFVITKRGKPVAKLVPVDPPGRTALYGYMKGALTIHGDIVGPTGEVWSADQD